MPSSLLGSPVKAHLNCKGPPEGERCHRHQPVPGSWRLWGRQAPSGLGRPLPEGVCSPWLRSRGRRPGWFIFSMPHLAIGPPLDAHVTTSATECQSARFSPGCPDTARWRSKSLLSSQWGLRSRGQLLRRLRGPLSCTWWWEGEERGPSFCSGQTPGYRGCCRVDELVVGLVPQRLWSSWAWAGRAGSSWAHLLVAGTEGYSGWRVWLWGLLVVPMSCWPLGTV